MQIKLQHNQKSYAERMTSLKLHLYAINGQNFGLIMCNYYDGKSNFKYCSYYALNYYSRKLNNVTYKFNITHTIIVLEN